jgi:hypothetical protein
LGVQTQNGEDLTVGTPVIGQYGVIDVAGS